MYDTNDCAICNTSQGTLFVQHFIVKLTCDNIDVLKNWTDVTFTLNVFVI